jgi:hypothetical protein
METYRIFFTEGSTFDVEADYATPDVNGYVILWVKPDPHGTDVGFPAALFPKDYIAGVISLAQLKGHKNRDK